MSNGQSRNRIEEWFGEIVLIQTRSESQIIGTLTNHRDGLLELENVSERRFMSDGHMTPIYKFNLILIDRAAVTFIALWDDLK